MLDMLVVSVEAGLGLDQAIQHVPGTRHQPPALSEGFPGQSGNAGGQAAADALRILPSDGRAGNPQVDGHLDSERPVRTSMAEPAHHSDFMRTAAARKPRNGR